MIISACMKEIKALPNIMAGDYEALVAYKMCIINNHSRLSAVGLEHEVSNTSTMDLLVSKLPWTQGEMWQMYSSDQDNEADEKPFETFLSWLEKTGKAWEKAAAAGMGRRGRSKSVTEKQSFHADVNNGRKRTCHNCGEEGHFQRNCRKSP